jgi:hypothetical protein
MAKAKKSKFKLVINWKKFVISSIAVFVGLFVTDYLIHGQLMMDLYQKHANLFRDMKSMESLYNYMIAGQILISLAFVFLYTQGYSGGKTSLGEGLRYGFYVSLLTCVAHSVAMYAWALYPMELLQAWAATGVVQTTILGGIAGLTYSHK